MRSRTTAGENDPDIPDPDRRENGSWGRGTRGFRIFTKWIPAGRRTRKLSPAGRFFPVWGGIPDGKTGRRRACPGDSAGDRQRPAPPMSQKFTGNPGKRRKNERKPEAPEKKKNRREIFSGRFPGGCARTEKTGMCRTLGLSGAYQLWKHSQAAAGEPAHGETGEKGRKVRFRPNLEDQRAQEKRAGEPTKTFTSPGSRNTSGRKPSPAVPELGRIRKVLKGRPSGVSVETPGRRPCGTQASFTVIVSMSPSGLSFSMAALA